MKNKPNIKKTSSGFTLIEMIVTVSIVAILASIAVPSFTSLIERNKTTAEANEMVSALLLARSEAIKRRNNVTVCTSTNQDSCAGNSLKDFSAGWIVFVDCNANGVRDTAVDCGNGTNEDEDIIKAQLGSYDGQLDFAQSAGAATGNEHFFTYAFSGRVLGATRRFSLTKHGTTTPVLKELTVALTGRVKTCDGACP